MLKVVSNVLIRDIQNNDAPEFINLIKKVESESDFMLMEPGERQTTPDEQRQFIEKIDQQSNSGVYVAEIEGELVGYIIAMGGNAKRTQHTAYLVAGMLQDYRGLGIGTKLFQYLEERAKKQQLLRLELTVVAENEAALSLYRKVGFQIEGTKRKSLMIEDKPHDEYYMSKLI